MKLTLKRRIIAVIIIAFSSPLIAQVGPSQSQQDIHWIRIYFENLGKYYGYDLSQYCPDGSCVSSGNSSTGPLGAPSTNAADSNAPSNTLIDRNTALVAELNLYNTFMGSIIGGISNNQESSSSPNPIVPTTIGNDNSLSRYTLLNSLAGQTYSQQPYSTTSTEAVSITKLIDQPTYQSDPVSQAILNILATPSETFCTDNPSVGLGSCPFLSREEILRNVVGPISDSNHAFTIDVNKAIIPQLNSNVLISPLMYTTTTGPTGDTSSGASSKGNSNLPTASAKTGLIANTQAQQAENFIRYAISAVNPIQLADFKTYNELVGKALNYKQNIPLGVQQQAQEQLSNYITKLRTYAAQSSVAVSNLYYIMSKRLPQKLSNQSTSQTSQALNEYVMASWRLYNPQNSGDSSDQGQKQWLNQINKASPATVQKEIAILLAEMNYQLYLMRQQQERILLTNSMQMFSGLAQSQPNNSMLQSMDQNTNPPPAPPSKI